MNHPIFITRGASILLGLSALVAGAGFALPRLRPVPVGADMELAALHDERDALATNDDATLESLRRQSKAQPPVAWSVEKFTEQVGTGWRVEWQQPDGASRTVLLTRSAPRLHDWPDYLRFLRSWAAQRGIVLESLDMSAKGVAQARELDLVVIGLRVVVAVAPIGNAERVSPSLVPLPVAPAEGAAATRKVGPGPSLRRPAASAEPPAPGQDSAPVRSDPPGARAANFSPIPQPTKP